jgi:hypothetical protein
MPEPERIKEILKRVFANLQKQLERGGQASPLNHRPIPDEPASLDRGENGEPST